MLAIAWVLIIGVAGLAFNSWLEKQNNPNNKPRSTTASDGTRSVVLRANRQHHYITTAFINGEKTTVLVDTGATDVVIPDKLARKLQLPKGQEGVAITANGRIRIYHTVIDDIRIGDIILREVRASVNPGMGPNDPVLLGMSALKNIELRHRDGELHLIQP